MDPRAAKSALTTKAVPHRPPGGQVKHIAEMSTCCMGRRCAPTPHVLTYVLTGGVQFLTNVHVWSKQVTSCCS